MKIHTRVVWQLTETGMELLEDAFEEYSGPIALAGGSGGGTQTVTQKTDPPAYLMPYLQEMLQGAQRAYANTPNAATDPTVNTSLQWLNQAAQQARQTVPGQQAGFADFMANAQNVEADPFLAGATSAAIRPLNEQFTQSILPAIRSGATGAGQPGSTRQGIAEGLAGQGLQRTTGDIATNIYSNAYNQGQNNYLQGLAMVPQVNALGEYPSSLLNKQYDIQASLPYENINRYASLLNNLPGSSTTGTQPGPYTNSALQALGATTSFVSLIAMLAAL